MYQLVSGVSAASYFWVYWLNHVYLIKSHGNLVLSSFRTPFLWRGVWQLPAWFSAIQHPSHYISHSCTQALPWFNWQNRTCLSLTFVLPSCCKNMLFCQIDHLFAISSLVFVTLQSRVVTHTQWQSPHRQFLPLGRHLGNMPRQLWSSQHKNCIGSSAKSDRNSLKDLMILPQNMVWSVCTFRTKLVEKVNCYNARSCQCDNATGWYIPWYWLIKCATFGGMGQDI